MPNKSDAPAFWNPGTKWALIVFVALMVGLKIIDTLVLDNGILSPTWRWPLIAGLCGGVYASVISAYQLGVKNAGNKTTDV